MFFVSGAAGLIYEIVWTRMLSYVFGTSTYALSAVVVAYMGGLALGAVLAGRVSDRLRSPLLAYAAIEVAIGALGGLLILILPHLSLVDRANFALFGQNFALLTAGRFIAAIGVLLIPTFLMGATLPLLSRAIVRSEAHLGGRVATLYGINTGGAVLGAFCAGFFLIKEFGLYGSEYVAVALNLVAACLGFVFWAMVRNQESADIEAKSAPVGEEITRGSSARLVHMVWAAAFLSGFVSLGCQILWSRSLVFTYAYLSSTTYCFSALLGVFLCGIALGSVLIAPLADRHGDPLKLYGLLLSLLGISLLVSLLTIYGGAGGNILGDPLSRETYELDFALAFANVILQTVFAIGIPTLLMGMSLPLAIKSAASVSQVGRDVGVVYALNTLGAILGVIATSFVLIPSVGLTFTFELFALIDVTIGVIVLLSRPAARRYAMAAIGATFALSLFTMLSVPLRGDLRAPIAKNLEQIYYREGPVATIAVYETQSSARYVFVDQASVAGTSQTMLTDQKSLAHIPMCIVRAAKAALTVGFGSGGSSYSYLRHSSLEKVHCVEIAPEIVAAASYLGASNHRFLEHPDPRYRIIFDDARAYLQYTDETYDIIATDCTDLRYKSNANLYDLEFFMHSRARLNPGGVVVVWMPLGGLSEDLFLMTLRTFYRAFPEMAVFYMNNEATHYVLLVGWRDEMEIDFELFQQRLTEPNVLADLAEIHLENPYKLLSTFVTAGPQLASLLGEGDLNTEEHPLLEFRGPLEGWDSQAMLKNLDLLMRHRANPMDWVRQGSITEEERARFAAYQRAMPLILQGHFESKRRRYIEASKWYTRALALTPDDRSLQALLNFPKLRHRGRQGDVQALTELAQCMLVQGRREAARQAIEDALQALSASTEMSQVRKAAWSKELRTWQARLEANSTVE